MMTSGSLRQDKKEHTRQLLVEQATRLFLKRGYDAVTAEDIARAAGVSRRTFFRYFPTKDAVVFPDQHARLELFRGALAMREPGETALEAVVRASLRMAREFMNGREELIVQQRILAQSPQLLAVQSEWDRRWEAAIAETLLGSGRSSRARERRARLAAGAIFGVIRVTLQEWYEEDGNSDLVRRGRDALEWLIKGLDLADTSAKSRGGRKPGRSK